MIGWIIFIAIIVVEMLFHPRLDKTDDGVWLLWVGQFAGKRRWIKLF